MKKRLKGLLSILCACFLLTGCIAASETPPPEDIVLIPEKLFIAQTNDIYYNSEDYLGKTIRYEGMFKTYGGYEGSEKYYAVVRYGPGCCGDDGSAGFEVTWKEPYPKEDEWVEATGVLELYEENGTAYLRLALTELEVLPIRGAEFVAQ